MSWLGHLPGRYVIRVNAKSASQQNRGMFTETPRHRRGDFYPELLKGGNVLGLGKCLMGGASPCATALYTLMARWRSATFVGLNLG